MAKDGFGVPSVSLRRPQWVRLIVVGIFVAFAAGRVVPEGARFFYPLGFFRYVTDGNGVVVRASEEKPPKGAQRIDVGDRVRIDRIKPFDRKPGLAEIGFTYDNRERFLPVERRGRLLRLHLVANAETVPSRLMLGVRILVFVAVVALGAILFLVQPGIATAAILAFCLGEEFTTTYVDLLIPNPWRQIPEWFAFVLMGAARPALLLFAGCLLFESPGAKRALTIVCGALALSLGLLAAFAFWRLTYLGLPSQALDNVYAQASSAITAITILGFLLAFARAHGSERRRIGWIVATFAIAGAARLASDSFYPTKIGPWENGLLLTATVLPIGAVWFAVVKHRFFNVDFVVNRAVVYVALTASVVGTIAISEEIGTYVFYSNTDLAYGFLIAISMGVGSLTGKIRHVIERVADRFIFRDRRAQRLALEFISGYILDAETVEDVYRALLADAPHALNLEFGGIFERNEHGGYGLAANHNWPEDCTPDLQPNHELTRAIAGSRNALSFSGKDSALIRRAFPNERLTFAAPLFYDRSVSAIIVYGRNVSGLDLDPQEREQLVEVVLHASIALGAIELAKYRAASRALSAGPTPAQSHAP